MDDLRSSRGGVVGEFFLGLVTLVGAYLTYLTIRAAIARFDDQPAFAAVAVLPALVTLTFGGLLAGSVATRGAKARFDSQRALYPDEPWRWEPDRWKDGRLREPSRAGAAVGVVICAVIWNAVAGGSALATWGQGVLTEKPHIAVMIGLFNAVGLGLIAAAVYFIAAAMKFSRSVFQMDSVPGVLGGTIAGTVFLPPQVPAGAEATVTLDCTSFTRGAGRSGNSSRCVWKDEARVRSAAGCLPVALTIPFDLRPTDLLVETGLTTIHWYLGVKASLPGVDYVAMFEVPVFATSASDRTITAGAVTAREVASAAVAGPPPNAKAVLETTPDGTTAITFPKAAGLGCGVVSLILAPTVAILIARNLGADLLSAAAWVSGAFCIGGAVAALMAFGVLATVVRAEVDGSELRLFYGKPPLTRSRTISFADIREIKYAMSGQTPMPRVQVVTTGGKSYDLGGTLSGLDEAKWLAAEVTRLVERARAASI